MSLLEVTYSVYGCDLLFPDESSFPLQFSMTVFDSELAHFSLSQVPEQENSSYQVKKNL